MRQATATRTRGQRERKERKRADKEWAKLNAQAARASQSLGGTSARVGHHAIPASGDTEAAQPPLPPPDEGGTSPPPPPPPPLPPSPPQEGGRWGEPTTTGAQQQQQHTGWQQPLQPVSAGGWDEALRPPLPPSQPPQPPSMGGNGNLWQGATTGHPYPPVQQIKAETGDPFALSALDAKAEPPSSQRVASSHQGVKAEPQRRPMVGFGGAAKRAPLQPTVAAFQMDSEEE